MFNMKKRKKKEKKKKRREWEVQNLREGNRESGLSLMVLV